MDPTTNPDPLPEKRGKDYEIGDMRGLNPYQKRTVRELYDLISDKNPNLINDENIDWEKLESELKEHKYRPNKEGNPWYKDHITVKFIRGRYEVWRNKLVVVAMARLKQFNNKIEVRYLAPIRNPHRVRYFQSVWKNSPFSKER